MACTCRLDESSSKDTELFGSTIAVKISFQLDAFYRAPYWGGVSRDGCKSLSLFWVIHGLGLAQFRVKSFWQNEGKQIIEISDVMILTGQRNKPQTLL
tara:strand:- start:1473 stop:1766 length:294 start_codon:yes stop_codon:yes gene_type:complete